MKLRKIVTFLVISIVILAISTNCFAVTAKNETEKKVSNSVSNKVENKEENKVKNTTKNETKKESKNEVETKKSSNKKTSNKKTSNSINEDVVAAEEDVIEYKDIVVNGNMFLASDKITLDNVKVDGDVIALGDTITVVDSEINGNLWTAGNEITVSSSSIISVYAGGNKVTFDEGTEIVRELRAAGDTVLIDAEVGRDAYIGGNIITFGDDANISGKTIVRSEKNKVSEDAAIEDLDYEKVEYSNGIYKVNLNFVETENKVITYLIGKGTEIAIILLIALFVLYGFPKFSEVNSCLRLRDFFKAFFTGILEILVIILIAIGLFCTVYGIGYGLLLLNLLITFILLGKVIFIISFAIRMSCKPEKISNIKAFFSVVLVAIVLSLIEMISITGAAGFIINLVINVILAITGLGSMFRVIFTSKKKMKELARIKVGNKTETIVEAPVVVSENVESKVKEVATNTDVSSEEELKAEIKTEVQEEIKELKEEREEEKKLEENEVVDEKTTEEKENNSNKENEDDKE